MERKRKNRRNVRRGGIKRRYGKEVRDGDRKKKNTTAARTGGMGERRVHAGKVDREG